MITLLAGKMFIDCNSSLLRQHRINRYLFVFGESVRPTTVPCRSTVHFVNNGLLVNSIPPPFRHTHTQLWPSGESLMNCMALSWVNVGHSWSNQSFQYTQPIFRLSARYFPNKIFRTFFVNHVYLFMVI